MTINYYVGQCCNCAERGAKHSIFRCDNIETRNFKINSGVLSCGNYYFTTALIVEIIANRLAIDRSTSSRSWLVAMPGLHHYASSRGLNFYNTTYAYTTVRLSVCTVGSLPPGLALTGDLYDFTIVWSAFNLFLSIEVYRGHSRARTTPPRFRIIYIYSWLFRKLWKSEHTRRYAYTNDESRDVGFIASSRWKIKDCWREMRKVSRCQGARRKEVANVLSYLFFFFFFSTRTGMQLDGHSVGVTDFPTRPIILEAIKPVRPSSNQSRNLRTVWIVAVELSGLYDLFVSRSMWYWVYISDICYVILLSRTMV